MNIPFSPPDISEREIESVVETLRSGWITTGPKTKEFEKQIAAYVGTERVVCLNSSTAAMEMTLRLLGIGPGDEVIVPPASWQENMTEEDKSGMVSPSAPVPVEAPKPVMIPMEP